MLRHSPDYMAESCCRASRSEAHGVGSVLLPRSHTPPFHMGLGYIFLGCASLLILVHCAFIELNSNELFDFYFDSSLFHLLFCRTALVNTARPRELCEVTIVGSHHDSTVGLGNVKRQKPKNTLHFLKLVKCNCNMTHGCMGSCPCVHVCRSGVLQYFIKIL